MTETEHLLTCLAEEAGEIVQACGKALRFGLDDGYPGTDRTNAGDIARECTDLMAVLELLNEYGALSWLLPDCAKRMETKKAKVREFMEYASQRGTLMPTPEIRGLRPRRKTMSDQENASGAQVPCISLLAEEIEAMLHEKGAFREVLPMHIDQPKFRWMVRHDIKRVIEQHMQVADRDAALQELCGEVLATIRVNWDRGMLVTLPPPEKAGQASKLSARFRELLEGYEARLRDLKANARLQGCERSEHTLQGVVGES